MVLALKENTAIDGGEFLPSIMGVVSSYDSEKEVIPVKSKVEEENVTADFCVSEGRDDVSSLCFGCGVLVVDKLLQESPKTCRWGRIRTRLSLTRSHLIARKTLAIVAGTIVLLLFVCMLAFTNLNVMSSRATTTTLKEATGFSPFSEPGEADFFNGTSMEHRNGTILYRYVCLQLENETGFKLMSYSSTGEPAVLPDSNGTGVPPLPPRPDMYNWAYLPVGKKFDEWRTDRESFFVKGNTVLLVNIFGSNPAHCMSDQIFSLVAEIPQLWNPSHYPNFLYVGKKLQRKCTSWCCEAFHHAGIIEKDANPIYSEEINSGVPVCFERLIVPRSGAYRWHPNNHVVQAARSELMKSTGLESAQWSELPKDMPILFYDRRDATRRIWNNSMEVKNLLEKEYHASVRLIGKEWKKLKFPEQTALYNAYPVIVAPHGAHLANLMFAREGTKVIELVCSEGGSCPRNSEAWTPSNNAYNWFPPFTRKIPLDHFQIPEFEGCLEDGKRLGYSPKSFSVNITTFLPCLASHLGLSPRSDAKLPRPRI